MPDDLPSALPHDLDVDLVPPRQLPFLRRLLARLMGRGLTGLRSQHAPSWSQGHADGYLNGHIEGVREGYEEGYLDGQESGRQVLVISDTRPARHRGPKVDDHLFDDWRLALTPELKSASRPMSPKNSPHMPSPARRSGR